MSASANGADCAVASSHVFSHAAAVSTGVSTAASNRTSTNAAGHFLASKAGMQNVDKQHVAKVVEEMSKGSKYYDNAQKRDEQLQLRIDKIKAQVAATSSSELRAFAAAMGSFAARVETERCLNRVWAVVDQDAFYALCEQRANPSLAGKAFAVGGMGMLCTSSYEARKFGVRAAQPGFIAKELCPGLLFVKPDFEKYTAAAEECRAILRRYDPNFSAMSLDEAFLDLTDYCLEHGILTSSTSSSASALGASSSSSAAVPPHCDDDAARGNAESLHVHDGDNDNAASSQEADRPREAHVSASSIGLKRRRDDIDSAGAGASSSTAAEPSSAPRAAAASGHAHVPAHIPSPSEQQAIAEVVNRMRAEIKEYTRGLTCSAGIAPNPMLAKILSNEKKPDGQMSIAWDRDAICQYMAALPVRSIPGVGKVTERILLELGMKTCADVLANRGVLRAAFNERMSHWLIRCCLGIARADQAHEDPESGHDHNADDVGRKSISSERTFADNDSVNFLRWKCEDLAASIARSMVEEGIVGTTVTVKMKLHTFEVLQKSVSLPKPTNDVEVIKATALQLLTSAFPCKLRLLGVRMGTLSKQLTKPTFLDGFVQKKKLRQVDGAGGSASSDTDDDVVHIESTSAPASAPSSAARPRPAEGAHFRAAVSASNSAASSPVRARGHVEGSDGTAGTGRQRSKASRSDANLLSAMWQKQEQQGLKRTADMSKSGTTRATTSAGSSAAASSAGADSSADAKTSGAAPDGGSDDDDVLVVDGSDDDDGEDDVMARMLNSKRRDHDDDGDDGDDFGENKGHSACASAPTGSYGAGSAGDADASVPAATHSSSSAALLHAHPGHDDDVDDSQATEPADGHTENNTDAKPDGAASAAAAAASAPLALSSRAAAAAEHRGDSAESECATSGSGAADDAAGLFPDEDCIDLTTSQPSPRAPGAVASTPLHSIKQITAAGKRADVPVSSTAPTSATRASMAAAVADARRRPSSNASTAAAATAGAGGSKRSTLETFLRAPR